MNTRRGLAVADGVPDRAAFILVRGLDRSDPPPHLLLGATAVKMALGLGAIATNSGLQLAIEIGSATIMALSIAALIVARLSLPVAEQVTT